MEVQEQGNTHQIWNKLTKAQSMCFASLVCSPPPPKNKLLAHYKLFQTQWIQWHNSCWFQSHCIRYNFLNVQIPFDGMTQYSKFANTEQVYGVRSKLIPQIPLKRLNQCLCSPQLWCWSMLLIIRMRWQAIL